MSEGDDLATLIVDALDRAGLRLVPGDVLVIAQKVVSKAEGRRVRLADVTPGDEALALAEETAKDPRLVQLILDESTAVVRKRPSPAPGIPGVIIVEHRCGWVHANAGIDQSNVSEGDPRRVRPAPAGWMPTPRPPPCALPSASAPAARPGW
ncbi:MAG: coenzyme F420-0:L-glutamate ligase [Gammaproteobacteria bacterium]|nr:coenzyme F420-0:L-glutamate ligase [Gammaproteobacteria bacterium]